jgi:hypothetical protein
MMWLATVRRNRRRPVSPRTPGAMRATALEWCSRAVWWSRRSTRGTAYGISGKPRAATATLSGTGSDISLRSRLLMAGQMWNTRCGQTGMARQSANGGCRPACSTWARLYFDAVRTYGQPIFDAEQDKVCLCICPPPRCNPREVVV